MSKKGEVDPSTFDDGNLPFPETIGEEETAEDLIGDEEGEEGDEVDPLDEIRAELEAERKARAESDAEYRRTINALIAQRPGEQRQQEPEDVNFDDLPDPVEDAAGYNRELQTRVNRLVDQRTQSALGQVDRQQAIDRVWTRFQTEHADLAKRSALLSGVVQVERQKLEAQGLDPITYISQNADAFIKRVADGMHAELGTESDPAGTQPASSRTKGLSAGSASPAPRKPAGKAPASFVKQLQEARQKDGLI